ncbi:MAG: hypothetical protein LUG88_01685 [Clostridia bacterium]|nr:hypothetical protein [Clostridia bacterium]
MKQDGKNKIFVLALAALLAALFVYALPLLADGDEDDGGGNEAEGDTASVYDGSLTLDCFDDADAWEISGGDVYMLMRKYSGTTSAMASGDDDAGFLFVRDGNLTVGTGLTLKREFDSEMNLYAYGGVTLSLNFTESDTSFSSDYEYVLTLTLYSGSPSSPEYTESAVISPDGQWETLTFSLDGWTGRGHVTGVLIALTVSSSDEETTDDYSTVTLRLDALAATGSADTELEDKFTTPAVYSDGEALIYDGEALLWGVGDGGSASWSFVFSDEASVSSHDTLRLVLISDIPVTLTLELYYRTADADGGSDESAQTASALGDGTFEVIYFDAADVWELDSAVLTVSVDDGGTGEASASIEIYGIDTLEYPVSVSSGTGSLDSCRMTSDGVLSLGGTIPSSTVAEYIDGRLSVYAVPVYADVDGTIESAEPIATSDMTTRFKIKIDEDDLPEGYDAMLFVVVIEAEISLDSVDDSGDDSVDDSADDGGEAETAEETAADDSGTAETVTTDAPATTETVKIRVGKPLPISYDGIGASVFSRSGSIKGICADFLTIDGLAAETVVTVDITELLGGGSSGRIYTYGGTVYYFDGSCLSSLDAKIKPLSLSGTRCLLYITGGEDYGGDVYIGESGLLFAVVDFLCDRYSSDDYGYISGVVLDMSDVGGTTEERAFAAAASLSALYTVGRHRIDGVYVYLSVAGGDSSADFAELITYIDFISAYMTGFGGVGWGIYLETESMASVSLFWQRVSASDGTSPSRLAVEYTPIIFSYPSAGSAMYDYISAYYTAAGYEYVTDFIFDATGTDMGENAEIYTEFLTLFAKLDTNLYAAAEDAANEAALSEGLSPSIGLDDEAAASRAHPFTYSSSAAKYTKPSDAIGEYTLFDFTSAYDTNDWFSGGTSECSSVKLGSARAMRAESAYDGIIYAPAGGLDLSGASVLKITCASDMGEGTRFLAVFISDTGAYTVEFYPGNIDDGDVYLDISGFDGAGSVRAIYIHAARDGNTGENTGDNGAGTAGSFYVRTISVLSDTLDDDALCELYASANVDDADGEAYETNAVMIAAVVFAAVVVTAAGYAFLRGAALKNKKK